MNCIARTANLPRQVRAFRSTILLVLLFLSAPLCTLEANADGLRSPTTDWSANWIGAVGGSKPNTWICFRKNVTLDNVPQEVEARIACDSKYWLWINGKLAVFEGQLKRGPTPSDTYYDRVSIASYLHKGSNAIAILVCHFGRHGFSHNSSGKAGLLFEADCGDISVLSDESWRVRVHPAFGTTNPPLDNVRPPEANIRYDARHDIGEWWQSDFDDSGWGPPTVFGLPPLAPWNNLYERPIPQWKNSGRVDYVNADQVPASNANGEIVCQLPTNCHVSPYLKVDAPAGKVIEIYSDIYELYGKIPLVEIHRHEYVTREGVQEFELPFWINGHAIHYVIPDGVKILSLQYRETGYDTEVVGEFRCSDPKLNQLWEESKRTLYVTMRDTYMDCPDRERAQWWGDAVNELGEAFFVFEPGRSSLLAKKGIYELTRWQRENNTLYSPVPSGVRNQSIIDPIDGSWDQELPRQMLASVGWYGFWTYYWYSDDRQTIVDAYPAVKRYLDLWTLGDDGLIVHRPGDWDWTDWGENRDIPVVENAWVYLAMKAAIEMAELAGQDQDIPKYRQTMESIKENFNNTFWQGDKYRTPGYELATDDRANAMAVVAGLADPAYYPAIRQVLIDEHHASPYMEKYVLEALLLMDSPDQAIDRMKGRYAFMLSDDKDTLWEMFDEMVLPGFGSLGRGTYNHAWSGGPLTIMSQYMAGVSPTAPAFREYQVCPQLGSLEWIEAKVPTRFGVIKVRHDSSGGAYSSRINSPMGTKAQLGIPLEHLSEHRRVLVNGSRVEESDVKRESSDESYVYFSIPPGEWKLTVVNK